MSNKMTSVAGEAERVYGYDGAAVVPLADGSLLYPVGNGLATAAVPVNGPAPPLKAERAKFWPIGDGAHQVGRTVINAAGNFVVATERRLKVSLLVLAYPGRRLVQTVPDVARVEVADMAFSRDGRFFAVLAGPPQCTLALYSVDASTHKLTPFIQATEQFGHHLRTVSFSPLDSDLLCTSGGGHCVFWSVDRTSMTLTPLEGAVTVPGVRITSHQWMPEGGVVCTTAGGGLVAFDDLASPAGVPLPNTGTADVVGSVLTRSHLVTAAADGTVRFHPAEALGAPAVTVETGVTGCTHIALTAARDAFLVGGSDGALRVVAPPGYDGRLTDDEFSVTVPTVATVLQGFGGPLVGVAHGKGTTIAAVARTGLLTTVDYAANAVVSRVHVGSDPVVVRGIAKSSMVVVGSQGGTLRIVDCTTSPPSIVIRGKFADAALAVVETDPTGASLVTTDQNMLFFFDTSNNSARYLGSVRLGNLSGVNAMTYTPTGSHLLVSHSSGDTSLLQVPTAAAFADAQEILQQPLFVNAWRLDMPVYSLTVGGCYEDSISIIAQSLDKEGRLYLLDRTLNPERRDRESRVLKPQVLLRDHEKKGARIAVAFGRFLVSAATDGRVCLRDAAAYMARLNPQPVTKERTEPLAVCAGHVSLRGGIADFCTQNDAKRLVTAGCDGTVVVWNIPLQALAATPALQSETLAVRAPAAAPAADGDDDLFYWDRIQRDAATVDAIRHQGHRKTVQQRIVELRGRLEAIRAENEGADAEEKVGLEDFLVQRHRKMFDGKVEQAVDEMRQRVEIDNLRRDYTVDLIRKQCWDCMGVKLKPLVALQNPGMTVHNFQMPEAKEADAAILRKLKFLRLVEEADRKQRNVCELEKVSVDPPLNSPGSPSQPAIPAADEHPDGDTPYDPVHTLQSKSLLEQASEDPQPFLYPPLLVFTRSRAILQKTLLTSRVVSRKLNFNKEFLALVDRKGSELHRIEERNVRCRLILKELGEDREIFAPNMSACEDPNIIFSVDESKVPADKSTDPAEKRRLEQVEMERQRWIARNGADGSSDRALKIWMDGRLDKDIRTLEINVPRPDFADETSERFVPLDERNDDQLRIFKEYEAALEKRINEVNLRREQLHAEFTTLQKANLAAAKAFDEALMDLFTKRLITSQGCFEVELAQIKHVQSVLLQEERLAIARRMEVRRKTLSDHLQRVTKENMLASARHDDAVRALEQMQADEKPKERTFKQFYPFNDAEYGEQLARYHTRRLKARKRQLEATQSAANQSITSVSVAGALVVNESQDPYALIELRKAAKQRDIADENATVLKPLDRPQEMHALPDTLWEAYASFRQERLLAEKEIQRAQVEAEQAGTALRAAEERRSEVADEVSSALAAFDAFLRDSRDEMYDVDEIHVLQQGQVEVEQAPVVTDFGDAVLVFSSVITRLNGFIRDSSLEKLESMAARAQQRRDIALAEWEQQYLVYGMRVLEMQLRHLHTLRVTKQMQEFINGGGENHNEQQRKKLTIKIDHVRRTMAEKIEERRTQMQQLRHTIRDREVENYILLDQVGEAKTLVDDRRAIRELQSSELDQMRADKLMRDMRVTRKLEDVAKSQQSEMSTMKKDIDKLRERTFPSFAVVSKRVVGNPDQL